MNRRNFIKGMAAVAVMSTLPTSAIAKEITSHEYVLEDYNAEINLKHVFFEELEYKNAKKRFDQENERDSQVVAHVGFLVSDPEPLDLGEEAYVFEVDYDSMKAWLVRVLDGNKVYGFVGVSNTDKGKDELLEVVTRFVEDTSENMIEILDDTTGNGWIEPKK